MADSSTKTLKVCVELRTKRVYTDGPSVLISCSMPLGTLKSDMLLKKRFLNRLRHNVRCHFLGHSFSHCGIFCCKY